LGREEVKVFWFKTPQPTGNFGDCALIQGTKDAFEKRFGDIEWITWPLRYQVPVGAFKTINSCDLVLIGPGGLILPDTVPDSVSGWQLNLSTKHIKNLQVPVVVLGIGWNLFQGQVLSGRATDSLRVLGDRADIFTARNSGSARNLQRIGLKDVGVCPCPSLFIETGPGRHGPFDVPHIGINLAGDRPRMRFTDRGFFAEQVRGFYRAMTDRGAVITFVLHSYSPAKNCEDIIATIPNANVRRIETNFPHEPEVLRERVRGYKDFDLVVGMRGHGCMVPFGQGVPVIAWATHDKVRWFMEDAGMKDCIVEADTLADTYLNSLAQEIVHNRLLYQGRVGEALIEMRKQFDETMNRIAALVPTREKRGTFQCMDGA
jgi:polysaccharide pyruvyl transferase WcaK-like protein